MTSYSFLVCPFNIIQLSLGVSSLVACRTDIFDMHLPRLTTLFTYLIALASASPIAWPDDKLEEINVLRAKGVSEVSRLSQESSPFRWSSCIYMLSSDRHADLNAFQMLNPALILTHKQAEIAARNPRPLSSPSPTPLSKPVSFFGRSIMGTADISLEPLGGTAEHHQRHFRESVGRRGEEIESRL